MSDRRTPNILRPASARAGAELASDDSGAVALSATSPGLRPLAMEIDPAGAFAPDSPASQGTPAATRVSVVLPVYNEAGLIDQTFAAVASFAAEHAEYDFLFVDDGSSDQTAAKLRALITRTGIDRIALLSYSPNRGKGHAVKAGIQATRGDLVLFTDGDLAYSLDHLPTLVSALASADVVIGNRNLVHTSERNTTLRRRIMGWTFNRCARVILGMNFSDTQAGLKGFRRDAAERVFALEHLGGFAFDVELVYIAKRLGYRIAEIPAHVSEAHSYKVSKVNLLRDPARMFGALVDVRASAWKGRYSGRA